MKSRFWGILIGLALLSTGCLNREFSCKGYPETQKCMSLSEVYHGGDPQAKEPSIVHNPATAPNATGEMATTGVPLPAQSLLNKPIVVAPQVVRVWIAPWIDKDNVLHDASYHYITIEPLGSPWVFGEHEVTGGRGATQQVKKTLMTPKPPKTPLERPGVPPDSLLPPGNQAGAQAQKLQLPQIPGVNFQVPGAAPSPQGPGAAAGQEAFESDPFFGMADKD